VRICIGNMPLRAAILLGILLGALTGPREAPATGPVGTQGNLESLAIGFSSGVMVNVDPKDAKAATKIWANMIVKRRGGTANSEAIILEDTVSAAKHLREKTVDLYFLLPQEFLKIRDILPIVPVVVSTPAKGTYEEFVLLVRKDSGVRSAGDLRGRRLTVETDQKGGLPLMWVEILLMGQNIHEESKSFFASIKGMRKASQTALPVFFRQADACVVTRSAFMTMTELNPQVGRELVPIASSPPVISSIGVLRKDYYDKHGAYLTEELTRLQDDPQGKQILTLFRTGRLVPYLPEHVATVEAMLKEHDTLRMKLARRP